MSQQPRSPAAKAPPTLVEVLLQIRGDLRMHQTPPYLYMGIPNVGRLKGFTVGYWRCTCHLGMDEGQDQLFFLWLHDVKKAWPAEGWAEAYLREFDGDHTRAVRKYLDYVAEFRSLSPEELAAMPMSNAERSCLGKPPSLQSTHPSVPTLDELLEIRRVGRILMYIGEVRVERMAGYIDGYRLCLSLAGLKDEEYLRFERWFQDTGRVPPGHTWEDALLQAAHGDHEAAILRSGGPLRALAAAALAVALLSWWVAPGTHPLENPSGERQRAAAADKADAGPAGLGEAVVSASPMSAPEPSGREVLTDDTLPEPLPGQARPDAKGRCPHKRQVALNGGCWVELDRERCEALNGYMYKNTCYVPVLTPGRPPTSQPARQQ